MNFIFKDPQYSFQLLRAIGHSPSGGADIGEVLKTAYNIADGNDESWYDEWHKTANNCETRAKEFLKKKHFISARNEYLRASNYYRTAEFFLHINPKDHRIVSTWKKSRECFLKAIKYLPFKINPVEIPFEETTIPGYMCYSLDTKTQKPLIIVHTGFDGTAEELYFQVAKQAVEHGYNCLIFEGPGQGRVIRTQHIPFRYNWETVVTPVIDFALKLPGISKSKIVLYGISFGGYLAPRAAAFDKRIKVCIANGGVYNFHIIKDINETDLDTPSVCAQMDSEVYSMMDKSPSLRWIIGNALFTFHAKTPTEWMRMTRPYSLKNISDKIKCMTVICDSEGDNDLPGQSKILYDALKCPKKFIEFIKEEGAEEHCQIGASIISNEKIFNYLDEFFKIKEDSGEKQKETVKKEKKPVNVKHAKIKKND